MAALPATFANPLFDAGMMAGPVAGPFAGRQPATSNAENGEPSTTGKTAPAPGRQDALQTWFPLRQPLLRPRAGSGRQTSTRGFSLQLKYEALAHVHTLTSLNSFVSSERYDYAGCRWRPHHSSCHAHCLCSVPSKVHLGRPPPLSDPVLLHKKPRCSLLFYLT